MSSVKNPQNVKRQLDEVDNMIMILEDTIRRGMKIDPSEAQRRFKVIREKIKFAQDNIQG
tara:strand:- start:32 stop:211 length:180 start_codon:yes stop_codon:yes gene_type:complete